MEGHVGEGESSGGSSFGDREREQKQRQRDPSTPCAPGREAQEECSSDSSMAMRVTWDPEAQEQELQAQPYSEQEALWPQTGRHILAHTGGPHVLVYQAFNSSIASHSVAAQRLGGPGYAPGRMSWIKTNFLWMMYRSGWGQKDPNQARILGLFIPRTVFLQLLALAVEGSDPLRTKEDPVRLQWDPDHLPSGAPHPGGRRAIQLGLRGPGLALFRESIVRILDLTEFCGRARVRLVLPRERVLHVEDKAVAARIQLDACPCCGQSTLTEE